MPVKYTNNAESTLASSINSAQTTISLQSGTGNLFPPLGPGDTFYAILVNTMGEREIVLATARSSDTLTVVRGQEGTLARAFPAGNPIYHAVTAAQLTAFFTTQNDGPGSGLDADVLDGQQGAFYQNASNLNAGTVPDGRFPATLPALSGANLTNLNASNLATGTVPDGRFPAALPAVSGANLTNLNANNLATGTVPDGRFPATLPALSGANLTNLNANNLATGTVPVARLTGTYNISVSGNAATASDAVLFGAQAPAFYRNASNLNAGTVPVERLTGTYNISVSGNAVTATTATTANNALNLGGQLPSFYQNANNLNAGILPVERLSGTYNINISGGANTAITATNLSGGSVNATTGAFSGNVTSGGSIIASGNVTAFSDARLKKDLEVIADAVERVKRLTGYTYTRVDTGASETGLVAQDVLTAIPQAVQKSDSGMYAVAYGNLMGLVVQALKEIDARLSALENQ